MGVDCADTVSAYSQQLHGRNIDYADTVSVYSQQLHGRNIDYADTVSAYSQQLHGRNIDYTRTQCRHIVNNYTDVTLTTLTHRRFIT